MLLPPFFWVWKLKLRWCVLFDSGYYLHKCELAEQGIWILHSPDFQTGLFPFHSGMSLSWVLFVEALLFIWYVACLVIIYLKVRKTFQFVIGIRKRARQASKRSFCQNECSCTLKVGEVAEWTFCRFNSMTVYWALGICQDLCWCWSYKNEQCRSVSCSEGAHCCRQIWMEIQPATVA